ncbi:MAG: hypothetical protein BWY43_00789 [candidate division WS2 bacterium ADurb.Bin280]|uniref:Uncharacterized protein n=1 Tax=candidate division WS2 bacterium ADurb.Bin280 TaxID=1852829 RepID=A0A1V5SBE3_9BACT|nr:MAG: hypothetical protein BWY43_00789 [candidate division WS2 bacterium ADurb.Bin280]
MVSRRGKILNLPFVVVGCFMLAMTLFFDTSKADETEDITISSNTSWSAGTYTYRDITITNNATLTLQGSYTDDNDGIGVTINARNITIDTGSSIRADGQGYLLNSGPGKGYIGKTSYGSGGAHGGNGGAASLDDIQLENSLIYDVIFRPSKLGSGGGGTNAGSGGGAIIINVAGDVNINGSISANGTASSHYKGGGGSGGTVSITANSVIGSGSISANGGNGNSGGGGGGIVSVYYKENFSLISGNISATGGSGFNGRFGDQGAVIIYNENQRDLNVIQNLVLRKN